MKSLFAILALAFLPGCGFLDEIRQENEASDARRIERNNKLTQSYTEARAVTGTVFNVTYTPGGNYDNSREGRASILVTPDNETNKLLRFDYKEERQFVSPDWGDNDIGVRDLALYHKSGTKITWKEGFRPYDNLVEHVDFYRAGKPLIQIWARARFKPE